MAPLIRLFKVNVDKAGAMAELEEAFDTGQLAQGPKVDAFEAGVQAWTGGHPVSVNSGTSAIALALRMVGVGYGDEVITTPMTCSATNMPIMAAGAKPVWADVDPRTGLIDVMSISKLLSSRTKAIIAVDWGGQPAEWDWLSRIAQEEDLKLIIDSAHSIGATQHGRFASSYAHYVCFSFQAIKHLTTGDGGALVVQTVDEALRAKRLRWFGIDRTVDVEFRGELDVEEWGYKYHMGDVAAAIGLGNLPHLSRVIATHRAHAQVLDEMLDERFIRTAPRYEHSGSWWLYTVVFDDHRLRESFKEFAKRQRLQVSQVHWRNDKLTTFKGLERNLPGLDAFADRMICLPVHEDADPFEVARRANRFWT